jgi:hypothetical protein
MISFLSHFTTSLPDKAKKRIYSIHVSNDLRCVFGPGREAHTERKHLLVPGGSEALTHLSENKQELTI